MSEEVLFPRLVPEDGLGWGGIVCLVEPGTPLAALEDVSPDSTHPLTSRMGISAMEVTREGGQLLAWPFWSGGEEEAFAGLGSEPGLKALVLGEGRLVTGLSAGLWALG